MGGTVTEPDWKTQLRRTAEAFAATDFRGHPVSPPGLRDAVSRYLMGELLPHVETAYKNGLDAGRSQTGYRLVQENERLRRELALAQQERKESP